MKTKFVAGTLLLIALTSRATIVSGGDGTQNATAPSGDRGWSYVGRISNKPSSVTYVSNNWFVTAYHVKALDHPSAVILGGTTYSIAASSWTRVTNSSGSDADVTLFRVTANVSGPSGLSIAASAPSSATPLTMIGNGRNRASGKTWWDASWNETNAAGALHAGYKWASGATKRWGDNAMEGTSTVNDGYGVTEMIYTDFDDVDGGAQGATYDSGGGVFVDDGGEWKLAGIMLTVDAFAGQPANTAVFGNRTYSADLSVYADQINAVVAVPEPSVPLLIAGAGGLAWFVRRRFMI